MNTNQFVFPTVSKFQMPILETTKMNQDASVNTDTFGMMNHLLVTLALQYIHSVNHAMKMVNA